MEADCITISTEVQMTPRGFHGKPVNICPLTHSAIDQMEAKAINFAHLGPLKVLVNQKTNEKVYARI